MEFMFWGCFIYDRKGPFYIWKDETAAEMKESKAYIDAMNEVLELKLKAKWEFETVIRRMGLKNMGGTKPTWKWD